MFCSAVEVFIKVFLMLTVKLTCVSLKVSNGDIDVNDILRTDLMPTYFIVEGETETLLNSSGSQKYVISNGSIDDALSTLDFHRYSNIIVYFKLTVHD